MTALSHLKHTDTLQEKIKQKTTLEKKKQKQKPAKRLSAIKMTPKIPERKDVKISFRKKDNHIKLSDQHDDWGWWLKFLQRCCFHQPTAKRLKRTFYVFRLLNSVLIRVITLRVMVTYNKQLIVVLIKQPQPLAAAEAFAGWGGRQRRLLAGACRSVTWTLIRGAALVRQCEASAHLF